MGGTCSTGCGGHVESDLYEDSEAMVDLTRLDLSSMRILDFERRVKKYAHPINHGRVTVDQLYEAFADTVVLS